MEWERSDNGTNAAVSLLERELGIPAERPPFVDDDAQNVPLARVVGFDAWVATAHGAWASDLLPAGQRP